MQTSAEIDPFAGLQPTGVIYADPPWRYDTAAPREKDRIESYYQTMPLEDIKALPVGRIALSSAVLFLWATNPLLDHGLEVMKAWGFTYRTNMVWTKDRMGLGFYWRQQHELLLLGIKGHPGTPPQSARWSSVLQAKNHGHSQKPDVVRSMVEEMYPAHCGTWLELFARGGQFPGWQRWGNQCGSNVIPVNERLPMLSGASEEICDT